MFCPLFMLSDEGSYILNRHQIVLACTRVREQRKLKIFSLKSKTWKNWIDHRCYHLYQIGPRCGLLVCLTLGPVMTGRTGKHPPPGPYKIPQKCNHGLGILMYQFQQPAPYKISQKFKHHHGVLDYHHVGHCVADITFSTTQNTPISILNHGHWIYLMCLFQEV